MAIEEVSVQQLANVLGSGVKLIDVREVDEYESGHVAGAINIPLSQFSDRLGEIPETTVFFICRSGGRSMQACQLCLDGGKTNVVNVVEGTLGWLAGGNDVVFGGQPG